MTGDKMVLTIALVVFFLILIVFIPHSVILKINIKYDEGLKEIVSIGDNENLLKIKLFTFIPVYVMNILKIELKNGEKKNRINPIINFFLKLYKHKIIKAMIKKMYVKEFFFSLGFNLDNCIVNVDVNAAINSLLCIIINSYSKNFNFSRLYYQTYISEQPLIFNFNSIIHFSVGNTIKVIVKQHIKEKKQITNFENRSDVYGRTSN